MKITFLMNEPNAKKHSTRFNLEKIESIADADGKEYAAPPFDTSTWKPTFYCPNPVGQKAKRLRVTIEELR